MKNFIRLIAVTLFVASGSVIVTAQAQTAEPGKRLVKIDESTGELVEVEQPAAAAPANPIFIVNSQNQKSTQGQANVQAQVQDQPTSVVEDSPLSISAAEKRRRERQQLEVSTEQKIVEKLEEARMEDEKRRSERLMKNFGGTEEAPAPAVQPQVIYQAPPQPVVVAPAPIAAPVVEAPKEEAKPIDIKGEVKAALEEMKPKEEPAQPEYYVGGLVGMGKYPDVINVRGNIATGVTVGMISPERFVAEGSFIYSEYDIEVIDQGYAYWYPTFKTMTQYNFTGGVKYQLLPGKFRPVVGALAGYTHRQYRNKQYYGVNSDEATTNSFDIGFVAGADLMLTKNFSVGIDFRYMKNVAYRENSQYPSSFVYPQNQGNPVEKLDYTTTSLVGKFSF